jgi:hypothetical protein
VPITSGAPGTAQAAPGTQNLFGVACPTSTTCELVGYDGSNGVVAPITSGSPRTAQPVSGTANLRGVACPSSTTCEAVGYNGSNEGVAVPITVAQAVSGTANCVVWPVLAPPPARRWATTAPTRGSWFPSPSAPLAPPRPCLGPSSCWAWPVPTPPRA